MPSSIAEIEQLSQYYHLPSVWMEMYSLELVRKGPLKWEEWLPDGLHPQYVGGRLYGEAVSRLLEPELLSIGSNPERQKGGDAFSCPP